MNEVPAKRFRMKAVTAKGEPWHYCYTRQDVDDGYNEWPGAEKMSITIRDKSGVVVGHKHFGEKGITWVAQVSE
jgi:hypothetical protein